MNEDYKILLNDLRKARGFNVKNYIDAKVDLINDFFKVEGLDSCVLGLSGGIDSSVVLALLIEASKQKDSPIKKIIGLSLPIQSRGTTGQNIAMDIVEQYLIPLYLDYDVFEYKRKLLYSALHGYEDSGTEGYMFDTSKSNYNVSDFAVGQLASVVRTPYMYYVTGILYSVGYHPIVVGTTNRDEGAYIGFYGKASDGMNDLQPIADIHKSEVYQVAEYLNIPKVIIDRVPVGDVYSNETDEELIGTSYDFVELHQLMDDFNIPFEENWCIEFNAILKIHNKNAHKYKVGLPARFVDVMKRKVNKLDGW